ncbi:Sulfotransferase 1 family member D1 [Holothuria leucospilota]|uniref:Sulfotransferase 1 family member D1 n=1 Tax=Holothuria leucospilota TaxID=206669 RepID=A0A9Q1BSM3_HOLLE|nr:Sulfotransferase 1 family member D1 [Holothuria leucospilota]
MPDTAIDAVKMFKYRDDDILIASYPKCGTHWINEVIQLMIHGGDPQQLDDKHRRVCLEIEDTIDISKAGQVKPSVLLVNEDPSPRVLMTHLTPGYLSEETWKMRIPVIYIFRDPRDVCLSFYKFLRQFFVGENEPFLEGVSFEQFLLDFIEGNVPFSGWCEHALSYEDCWKRGENILFITYEDMNRDLSSVITAVGKHIGCPISDDVMEKVIANSTKEAMQKNYNAKEDKTSKLKVDVSKFVNTGVSGNWEKVHSDVDWCTLNSVFKEKVKDSEFAQKYFDL